MSLQPKGSGKPSQKQTLKRSKVRVKSQQMSGRGSSQGQSRTKTRYFAAADLLQIYQIRWTTHSTIIAGEIFPNTLPRVHHCTLWETCRRKHSSEQRSIEVTWPRDLISHKSPTHRKKAFKHRPEGKGGPGDVSERHKEIKLHPLKASRTVSCRGKADYICTVFVHD